MELLAPAGNMESLKVAIYNGADAVYLGIKQFNARNNIDGFTLGNLGDAVDFAHLYGVKVYLALNILFTDDELKDALDIVCEANNLGVDAFIVQDLGLVYLIKKYYPTIELHASTQMAVHNLEGVKVLEKLGFTRVVLARETSMVEIERITKNSDMEVEFFVQGALCVSFSGNCYMCSHLVDKSGNRGLCQQFCRLPYTFKSGGKQSSGYLLSAKDICMLDELETLKQLGVCSLKIEGRARRPFYVGQACKIYRDMLDNNTYTKSDMDALKIAFNREYTPAYFNGNGNIISKIQGNNGLEIGVVKQFNKGKKFNEVFVSTKYNLQSPCGLKFIHNGQEIASIGAHDIIRLKPNLYRLTTTAEIKADSKVHIIQDETLEQELINKVKKLKIDVGFNAKPNLPIKMIARYDDIMVESDGEVCQQARTISSSRDKILQQLERGDVFEINNFECNVDNCYILNSSINKLRNDVYSKLKEKIIEKYQKNKLIKINKNIIKNTTNKQIAEFNYKIINNVSEVNNKNNLNNISLIYDYNTFNIDEIKMFDKICKQHNIDGYIDTPNFAIESDIKLIENAIKQTDLGVVANNLYALKFDCKMIGGQFLNVYNSYTIKVLNELHKLDACFVEELDESEIMDIQTDIPLIKRERAYMTLLHCPFKQHLGCDCSSCGYGEAEFVINSGKHFKVKRKKTATCVFMLKD